MQNITSAVLRLGRIAIASASVLCFLTAASAQSMQPAAASAGSIAPRLESGYGTLPLSFEINRGQTAPEVSFVARGRYGTIFLTQPDAVLETTQIAAGDARAGRSAQISGGSSVRMHLIGAATTPATIAETLLPGTVNYFTGQDRLHWQTSVPTFGRVRFASVYPGTDLAYYGRDGQLEYDFIVGAHADPSRIRLRFDGAEPHLTAAGALSLAIHGAPSEAFLFQPPVAYQVMENGSRQPVESSFALASNGEVAFHLGAYDASRELVIDPTLLFAGTLGTGNQQSVSNGMAVDAAGEIILTGVTNDLAFPTTTGVIYPTCGGGPKCGPSSYSSAFISKISADGKSLVFSTYLRGLSGIDAGYAVTVDAAGVIYATGTTMSIDFPVTADAYQKICNPTWDYTLNGGAGGITSTCSGSTSIYASIDGNPDMYLVKLNATGTQLLYSTFFGGTSLDVPTGIALDATGNIYLSGYSGSAQTSAPSAGQQYTFPVTSSAYLSTGVQNGFSATISKLSNDGHTLLYSSFLGSRSLGGFGSFGHSLAVGQSGVAFLGGYTSAPDFPLTTGSIKSSCTTDPANPARCMGALGFAAAFDTTKSGAASLVYSTLVGGNPTQSTSSVDTQVSGMVADASNDLFITGATLTPDFPTTAGVYQPTCSHSTGGNCKPAAFLSKINPTGSAYLWSTFYGVPTGSTGGTQGNAIAMDSKGRINLFGYSQDQSLNLPQVNPIQAYQGGDKVFLATFTSDGTQLVFASRFGGANSNDEPISYGGLALDSSGNVYFGGSTPNGSFPVTTGTYATTVAGGFARTFFAKISPVLFPTTNTLTVSPLTTVTGVNVTFTAVIASSLYSAIPTGTVNFMNGATVLGTGTLDSTGKTVFTTTSLAAATYTVTAVYSADTNYAASTSAVQTLKIDTPLVPGVALTLSGSSVTLNSSATLTATVTGTGATPTGTVTFDDGIAILGSGVLNGSGVATYSTSTLVLGSHSITAYYPGDNVYGPLTSAVQTLTVNKATPVVTVTSSANPVFVQNSVTLTVTISSAAGSPTGTVTFQDGGVALSQCSAITLTGGMASCTISIMSAASHSITAVYSGDANFLAATSSALTEAVGDFTITAPGASVMATAGGTAGYTINVSPASGASTFPAAVTLSVGGLPTGATYTFTPASLAASASATNVTLTIQLPLTMAAARPSPGSPGKMASRLAPFALALLLLPFAGRMRKSGRRFSRVLSVLLLSIAGMAALAGLSGCSSNTGFYGQQQTSYTLTVTATSGALLHSTTVALTVETIG